MNRALHAAGSGIQTVAIVAALAAVVALLGYALLVFGIVAIQAFSTLGQ